MDKEPHGEEDGIAFSWGQKKEGGTNQKLLQNYWESKGYRMLLGETGRMKPQMSGTIEEQRGKKRLNERNRLK